MSKKVLLVAVPLVLLLSVSIFIKSKSQTPLQTSSPDTKIVDTSKNNYQGTYFSFNYPLSFDIKKVNTTDGRVLENWLLTENSTANPTTVLITLFSSTKDLGDFEPVQSRRSNTSLYLEEVGRMKDQRGILFRTIDRKERTAYFTNHNQILSVDYIAKNTDPAKETEFQAFLENINWQ